MASTGDERSDTANDVAERPDDAVSVHVWPGKVFVIVTYREREVAMQRMIRSINGPA